MRKAIIATIVASALFAVGAFAAEFTINAEDVASGQNSVAACAERVDVSFEAAVYDATESRYEVPSFTVKFYDEGPGVTNDCDGKPAEVVIQLTGLEDTVVQPLTVGTGVTSGTITYDFGDADPAVSTIEGVAVLVEDIYLNDVGDQFTPGA